MWFVFGVVRFWCGSFLDNAFFVGVSWDRSLALDPRGLTQGGLAAQAMGKKEPTY